MSSDRNDKNTSKEWYLEYRGHRLGPLRLKDIVKGVQRGDLSAKVMISRDQEKWVAIKDSPDFHEAALQILAVKLDSEEDWKRVRPADFVESSISLGRFQAFQDYEAMMSGVDQQLNEALQDRRKIRAVREDGIERSKSIFTSFATDSGEGGKVQKSKVPARETPPIDFAKRKKERVIRLCSIGAGVVVVGYLGIGAYENFQRQNELKRAQTLGKQAQSASHHGDFETALSNLKEASELDPSNPALKIDLAKVLVRTNQSSEAQVFLNEVVATPQAERYFSEAFGLTGLVALERKDLDFAARQLDLALKQEPSSPPWLHNLAVVSSERGKWEEAEDLYLRAIVAGSDDPATFYGAAEATLKGPESPRRTKSLVTVDRLIGSAMARSPAFSRQLLAIRARLAVELENTAQAENFVESMLNVDPFLEEKMDLDVRYSRIRMSMSNIGETCRTVDSRLQRKKILTTALGLCLAWSGDIGAALTFSNLVSRSPSSEDVTSLTAAEATIKWTASVPGSSEELEAVAHTSGFIAPLVVAGHLCEQGKRQDCATKIWERVLELDPKNLAALVAMGRHYIMKKEPHRAKVYITKAKDIESRYFPVRNALNELLNFSVAL